jgi:hypothetical protein
MPEVTQGLEGVAEIFFGESPLDIFDKLRRFGYICFCQLVVESFLLNRMKSKYYLVFTLLVLLGSFQGLFGQVSPAPIPMPQPFSHLDTVPLWVPSGPSKLPRKPLQDRMNPSESKPKSLVPYPGSFIPDPDMRQDGAPPAADKTAAAYEVQVLQGFVANNMASYTPADNSMGISDGGYIVNADNLCVDFYRDGPIEGKTTDPRVIYDRYANRFIVIDLLYDRDTTNYMLISFSRDENPLNGWNHYRVRTDSLDEGQWMDFPSIGMNKGELFVSGHMASDTPGLGEIRGNKLFQIQKQEGYAGASLKMKVWYDVLDAEGDYVHTLVPLSEAMMKDSYDKGIYLVSTKDLDPGQSSDKLFWYHINDNFDAPGLAMTPHMTSSLVPYMDPQFGAQLGSNDLIDLTSSKVHSGFFLDSVLNFVYCKEFNNYSVIVLNRLDIRTGSVLRYPWGNSTGQMEYSFPSIAFSGVDSSDADNITLGFLRTGVGIFPEIAAVHFDDGVFWNVSTVVKPGEGWVDYFPGNDPERIGDYTSMQRRYNSNPPRCWLSADYPNGANANHWGVTYRSNTYIAELGQSVQQGTPPPRVTPIQFVVFPNPAPGLCTIEAEDPRNLIEGCSVWDVNGRLLARHTWPPASKQSLDLGELPSGIFTLEIQLNKGGIHYEKLVKYPLD